MTDLSVDIDFIILNTFDKKIISIGDISKWGVAENLPANILITPPGSTRRINVVFSKHQLNIFNSTNLGQSCVTDGCGGQRYEDLADGVWEFCLQSAYEGLEKKRYFLKDDSIRLELSKMYIKQNLKYDPDSRIFKDAEIVRFLLESAQAFMLDGDISMAKIAFDSAQKELEKYNDCKNCI
jgi:hypothetical protein